MDGEPLFGATEAPTGWWQTSFVSLLGVFVVLSLAHTFRWQNHAAQASGTVADILGTTAGHGAMITHPFAGFAALASLTVHLHLFVMLAPSLFGGFQADPVLPTANTGLNHRTRRSTMRSTSSRRRRSSPLCATFVSSRHCLGTRSQLIPLLPQTPSLPAGAMAWPSSSSFVSTVEAFR